MASTQEGARPYLDRMEALLELAWPMSTPRDVEIVPHKGFQIIVPKKTAGEVDQGDSAGGGNPSFSTFICTSLRQASCIASFSGGSWQCRPGVVAAQQLRPQAAQDELVTLWAGFAE